MQNQPAQRSKRKPLISAPEVFFSIALVLAGIALFFAPQPPVNASSETAPVIAAK